MPVLKYYSCEFEEENTGILKSEVHDASVTLVMVQTVSFVLLLILTHVI